MLKVIKNLLGVVGREEVTADDLATSLRQADAEVTAAGSGLEAAEAAYREGLLVVDDAALKRLDEARTEARLRVDRANAVRAALSEKRATAEARESEARKRAAYDEAVRQSAEAQEILRTIYPGAAADIVRVITAVAAAEVAVRRVNDDLPEGAPVLRSVEGSVRDSGSAGRRVVSEETVYRWCRPGQRMPGIDQSRVVVTHEGHGYIQPPTGPVEYLVRRKYTERVVEEEDLSFAYALAETVNLPGLGVHDTPIWDPLSSNSSPATVLNAAENLVRLTEEAAVHKPRARVKTELVLLDRFDPNESARPGPRAVAVR
ncbi:hypothetical protein ACQVP2_28295 [Methylobacterium aquaticum]|uniref:hypothetical protein n=1 Tax=Methylobacterium aquaticum TaxID=270351 RepID=UPI003D16DCC4